jgi:hypothetical protein
MRVAIATDMTNAKQIAAETARNAAYVALDKAFEENEITVRECRMQEAEIEARYELALS